MTAIPIPIAIHTQDHSKPVKSSSVPRAKIGPKSLPVDHLAEARVLSGIPIHVLQEFIELNSRTSDLLDVRKLVLEGGYQEIVSYVTFALKSMYRSRHDLKKRTKFFEIHLGGTNARVKAAEIEELIISDSYREMLQNPSLIKAIHVCSERMVQIKKELEESSCIDDLTGFVGEDELA
jgi:hypothetical protein